MIVDASVAVKWFLAEQYSDIARNILTSGSKLYAPDIVFAEVLSAMTRACRESRCTVPDALAAQEEMEAAFESYYPLKDLARRGAEISESSGAYLFDCLYLAAADMSDTLLVTADERFKAAIKQFDLTRRIVILKDWVGP